LKLIYVKRMHKHRTVTTRAIRQRSGIPYEVERKVCTDCRRLLEEKPVKRASAA
jgi:NMD protein affecting ribosome stability and mRNA decay